MKLSFEQICAVTHGAAQFLKEADGIRLRRLTEEQLAAFYAENPSVGNTCAGIKLVFRTDSRHLGLKFFIEVGAYWWPLVSCDVVADGKTVGYLDNFSHIENFVPKFEEDLPLGEFSKEIDLGPGEKTVTVHLPWCQRMLLQEVMLDDGTFCLPVSKKKLLMYGDSITQGFCAMRPSRRLAALVAAGLDMEECNRTMAGSTFLPDVAAAIDPVKPDAIIVTYGSNDWGKGKTAEKLRDDCRRFLLALQKNSPGVPIAVVSPIWRSSFACCNPCIDYETATESIRSAAAEFENVFFICGSELLPHDNALLFDGLHPNDEGMAIYAENLIAQLKLHFN